MEKKIYCMHHVDNDGYCSAAIVAKYYGTNITFVPMQYSWKPPFDMIEKNSKVIIVDFSLESEDDWKQLMDKTDDIVWIDHHKTMSRWESVAGHLHGVRENTIKGERVSAAWLTWMYFYGNTLPMPAVVTLVDDYDVWKHALGMETWYFQWGAYLRIHGPNDTMWQVLLHGNDIALQRILDDGKIIHEYNQITFKRRVKSTSFIVDFEGYRCRCINYSGAGSSIFEHLPEKDYDIAVVFFYNGRKWTCSLYTEDSNVDVSEIAKKYGGGGHAGAAGFICDFPPFLK